jgi:UDP-N-acetylglucosamine diphosphorylase/glucosamine-1-phosphate N-acetyltransferase
MSNIILFDSEDRNHLLPLTATRPMGELLLGAMTLREKWERRLQGAVSYITQEYLQEKYPIRIRHENLIINSGILPNDKICRRIADLGQSEALLWQGELLAARLNEEQFEDLLSEEEVAELQGLEIDPDTPFQYLSRLWELTRFNQSALADDFAVLTAGKTSEPLPGSNRLIGPESNLFIEPDAKIECSNFNVDTGPIYIGAGAEIMEGCSLRGPVYIGPGAILKLGAKLYGPCSIGPGCRAGGEITRSILMANSNKAHEGYLGDSVLGEWCNIGAGSNNSNLKNNYAEVKLWNYPGEKFERSGQQFCGLFMGDHSKCGISTMFNTGTVTGVFANIFGSGYQRNFIPDFSWGGTENGYKTYKFADACTTAESVLSRRSLPLTEVDKGILQHIFEETGKFRSWEK